MKRNDVEQRYRLEHGVIRSPGKFEGEPLWVPVFWERALEDGSDEDLEDDGDAEFQPVSVFVIENADLLEFPELEGIREVRVWEDDQGFVHSDSYRRTLADYVARGFDATTREYDHGFRVRCSACSSMIINGVATHELGCPNNRRAP